MTGAFGPAAAASLLVAYVKAEMPAILAASRTAYDITSEMMPDAKLVTAAELPEVPVDSWPAVMVLPERLVSMRRADVDQSGGPIYWARYRLGIETYVRAQGFEATGALNQRYAGAIAALLARDPQLRVAGAWAPAAPRVDVESITQEYSPSVAVSAGRTIASARTLVEVTLLEAPRSLGALPSGLVSDVSLTTSPLPPRHPALR